MEKDWPPLEECCQYKYGIIRKYLQKFDWESDEGDETFYVDYAEDEEHLEDGAPRTFAFKPSSLRKFVEIARTSRTGKVYKHVDTLKVIDTRRHSILLLTFTAAAKDQVEMEAETFLAGVYAPGACREVFELEECFLKPEGPAPWTYVELNDDQC
ncbi:hypothetical protein ACS0TY_013541 [Phlomoides rotata]